MEMPADASVETVYNELTLPVLRGILVAQFDNVVAALVFKDRNKTLKLPGVSRAAEAERRSLDGVAKQAQHFLSAKCGYGNFQLHYKGGEADNPRLGRSMYRTVGDPCRLCV